jgi:ubiquinol-cytochrome c reductase cytochrome c subunit
MRVLPPAVLSTLALAALLTFVAPPGHAEAQDRDVGERLYQRDCVWCHGVAGEGSTRGVPLVDVGTASVHFYLSTGRMPIERPDDPVTRSEPAYDDDEIRALVTYLDDLIDGPTVPDVRPVDDVDLAGGGVLYRRHCAQCHGASGVGTALKFGAIAPSVLAASPVQVAESLMVGPGAMPVFSPGVLEGDEIDAVTRYVGHLQESPDPGGSPLARAGRFDEMVVAWVLGIGALLLGVRWIGRPRGS